MIFEKSRFEIWNQLQHPYKHSVEDFAYTNEALPNVNNLESALNYILAVLYPNTKESVATVGDLPLVGNDINDYRVVLDDGDGKAASYRWEQRQEDLAPRWYKIYDMDWGEESILSDFLDKTQNNYVMKYGWDDRDEAGVPIVGTFAGQHIYGGKTANTNLTLEANSGDGVGLSTGFIQFVNSLRPYSDNLVDVGTLTEKFKELFVMIGNIGKVRIETDTITATDNLINIVDAELVSNTNIEGSELTTNNSITAKELAVTPIVLPPAGFKKLYFKDNGGLFSLDELGNETLLVGLQVTAINEDRLVKTDGVGGVAVKETGIIVSDLEEITGVTAITSGNVKVEGNTISTIDLDGNLNLTPNGTGRSVINSESFVGKTADRMVRFGANGELLTNNIVIDSLNNLSEINSLEVGNLLLSGSELTTSLLDEPLTLSANGLGKVEMGKDLVPTTNLSANLGEIARRFDTLFVDTLNDGVDEVETSVLTSLRNINTGATSGMSIFYDEVLGTWYPSIPDIEISHSTIAGLANDDHLQYALLIGRELGQELTGGTLANENLILESTSNAVKGNIRFKSTLTPFVDSTYSLGVWNGIDLGNESFNFRHLHMKGELKGARLENFLTAGIPAASGQQVGRVIYDTEEQVVKINTGVEWIKVGGSDKFLGTITFDGIEVVKNIPTTGIEDARLCTIQLLDIANDYERIFTSIKATSATNIRITTNLPLPAGNYQIVAMG